METTPIAITGKQGEKTTVRFKGMPARLMLRIVTPGGTIVEAPLAPHAEVDITGGADGSSLDLSVSILSSESGEEGLQAVR